MDLMKKRIEDLVQLTEIQQDYLGKVRISHYGTRAFTGNPLILND